MVTVLQAMPHLGWRHGLQEFPQRPREYYEKAVEEGRLRMEGFQVAATTAAEDAWFACQAGGLRHCACVHLQTGVNHLAKSGHRCRHFVHRHEPPVLDTPVQVLAAVSKELQRVQCGQSHGTFM